MQQHPVKESGLRRLWDSIKPPPPVSRADLERHLQQHPSAWRRFWQSIKPPPKVAGAEAVSVGPEVQARRRRILWAAAAVIAAAIVAGGAYYDVSSSPKRAAADLAAGMRLAAVGQDQNAVRRFSAALSIDSRSVQGYLQRGLAYRHLGQTDPAFADFQQALKINPNLAAAHTAMGEIYRDRGDLNAAMTEFTAGINAGANVDAIYQRGQTYESLGQYQNALQDYNAAIVQMADAPYVYRARASVREKMGDPAGAAEDRQTAFQIEHARLNGPPDTSGPVN